MPATPLVSPPGELNVVEFDYLLRGPKVMTNDNPLPEWISDSVWASVQSLKEIEVYSNLPDDIIGSAKRWKEWMELERPESEPMPGARFCSVRTYYRRLRFHIGGSFGRGTRRTPKVAGAARKLGGKVGASGEYR